MFSMFSTCETYVKRPSKRNMNLFKNELNNLELGLYKVYTCSYNVKRETRAIQCDLLNMLPIRTSLYIRRSLVGVFKYCIRSNVFLQLTLS